jgi:hypothetical protein
MLAGMTASPRTDTADYLAFMRRIMRASSSRVGAASLRDFRELLAVRAELNTCIAEAARGLNANGYTWEEIGSELGCSRQAAWERFGKA